MQAPRVKLSLLPILAAGFFASFTMAGVHVQNLHEGETIEYSAPLLLGTVDDRADSTMTVTNLSSQRDGSRVMKGLTHDGRFKVMTELVPARIGCSLTAGGQSQIFTLRYKPQTNPNFIRAVYFADETGDTHYDTPLANDPQNYAEKYDAILKLMQTFTAEWMNHYGYGRRTFNLELDAQGKVVVHVVKGSHPAHYYQYELKDRGNLYDTVTDEIIAALPKAPSVDCTLIAFSKLDFDTGHSVAYTALGGGKVALFGGACMYSFPNSVADIQNAFLNGDYIDGKHYVSDSVGRFTMWATASTSIGAMMHETGHSMGLPHTLDRRDMMTRGMDYISRNFVFAEPPSLRNPQTVYFSDNDIGYWSPESAAALAPSVWFRMDSTRVASSAAATTIELSPDGTDIVVKSPSGVGFVGYEIPGAAKEFVHIDQSAMPKEVHLPLKTALAAVSRERGQIRVIDGNGNMSATSINEFGQGFVRDWHFIANALPWKQEAGGSPIGSFRYRSDDGSARQAANNHREIAANRFRSTLSNRAGARVAYVLRNIKSASTQTIKLLTGSDDGMRLWINGKLITDVPKPRAAHADTDSKEAELRKGDNPMLVEVTDTGGAWALYVRMTDSADRPLQLNRDGTLQPIVAPTELMK